MFEEPRLIDLVAVAFNCGPEPRELVRQWDRSRSDVAGCFALVSPMPLRWTKSLTCQDVPVLALHDKLHELGYYSTPNVVAHSRVSELVYDARNPSGQRAYLQCVLGNKRIFDAGVAGFKSGLSQAFYKLLFKSPKDADPAMSAARCRELCALADGVDPGLAALDNFQPSSSSGRSAIADAPRCLGDDAPLLALLGVAAPVGSGIEGDDGSSGVTAPVVVAPALPIATPALAVVEGDGPRIPAKIMGQTVKYEKHLNSDGTTRDEGLRVKCPNALHGSHSKFRSLRLGMGLNGPRACEFYLIAWVTKAFACTLEEHRKGPSSADVQAIAETYG